jgi:hypothetical protein
MDRIYEAVTDPLWLFTVVIAAVLVNLISQFLGKRLERQLADFSESRRERLRQKKEWRELRIRRLAANGDYMEFMMHVELRYWIWLIIYVLALFTTISVIRDLPTPPRIIGLVIVLFSVALIGYALYVIRAAYYLAHDLRIAMRLRLTAPRLPSNPEGAERDQTAATR